VARPERSRAWRLLRLLLPAWYRERWGGALLRAHRDRVGGPARARGLSFWGPLVWDVLLTAVQTRWTGPEEGGARSAGEAGEEAITGTTTGGWEMRDLTRELRITLRTLLLGLGIGVATTIFSVVNGALLRPLPFPEADELVSVRDHYRSTGGSGSVSVPNFLDLRESATTLEAFAAYSTSSFNLSTDGSPERVRGLSVTHDFLETLGVTPHLGRDPDPGEDRVGRPPIAVVGHGLWRERFAGSRDVLGRTLLLNGEPHRIVGVLPRDFWFPGDPRILVPFEWDLEQQGRGSRWLTGVARLRDGVAAETAQAELRRIFAGLEEEYPDSNRGWTVALQDLKERAVGRNRTAFYLLGAASILVLLIGFVNVANLMLVRGERRTREMAVRAAMGGGRGRITRQFVVEGLLVTLLAAVVGTGIAYGGIRALLALWGSGLPRVEQIGIDGQAMAFSVVLALVVGVAVGMVPALRTDLRRLYDGLREGGRRSASAGSGLQRVLVGVEVALAVVLVTGAGLLVHSALEVSRVDPGVELEGAFVFSVQLPPAGYPGAEETLAYFEEALDRIGRIPRVEEAAITPRAPLQGGYNVTTVSSPLDPDLEASFVEIRAVTPDFFRAAGIPLLEGRGFRPEDADAGGAGIVISDALARTLFPDRSAVGQTLDPFDNGSAYRIVGVVGSVREFGLLRDARPAIYWKYGYPGFGVGRSMTFVVRAGEEPLSVVPGIRRALHELDPDVPLYSIRTLEDVAVQTVGSRTLATQLFAAFAVMALLLAAIGIFGTVAYVVEQRTREIGIRMAVGADRGEVVRMVVSQGMKLVGLGLVAGVGAALASGRLLEDLLYDENLLYEVTPSDPWTLAIVVGAVAAASALATWMPARKAAAVAPTRALRAE